jgi:hypothetical protein
MSIMSSFFFDEHSMRSTWRHPIVILSFEKRRPVMMSALMLLEKSSKHDALGAILSKQDVNG